MVFSKKKKKRRSTRDRRSAPTVLDTIGDATSAILLLDDYQRFGFAERVCYHFDLMEMQSESSDDNISPVSTRKRSQTEQNESMCGVVRLLECTPPTSWDELNNKQRNALENELKAFNKHAKQKQQEFKTTAYEPKRLPLNLNPSTRIFFSYRLTRMAFCVDASPSMASTFGMPMGVDADMDACCPLDRLAAMAATFFRSLVEPIEVPFLGTDKDAWTPEIAISVIAVFPHGKHSETNLLVRDFHLHDAASADRLASKIDRWAKTEVEDGIACRVSNSLGTNEWAAPLHSSSLKDIMQAGDCALDILSSEASPCLVVATDGRSISCDDVKDVFLTSGRADVPVTVLDLSSPESHSLETVDADEYVSGDLASSFLTYDPPSSASFPLNLSDDTEELYDICKATGGCFFDSRLLDAAASGPPTRSMDRNENRTEEHFFTFHDDNNTSIRMNGVQWLTLFTLSPLSPALGSDWSKFVPPDYLRSSIAQQSPAPTIPLGRQGHNFGVPSMHRMSDLFMPPEWNGSSHKRGEARASLPYSLSPIRIKGLILMRIRQGYRIREYKYTSTGDGKTNLLFVLPLMHGSTLHYELLYTPLPGANRLSGSAHVKMELSGSRSLVDNVKLSLVKLQQQQHQQQQQQHQYQHQQQNHLPGAQSMAQMVALKLARVLHQTKHEDWFRSTLCPLQRWSSGQIGNPERLLLRRLASLTDVQRQNHFHRNEIDVICTGSIPPFDVDNVVTEYNSTGTGEAQLIQLISRWTTQTIDSKRDLYIKILNAKDEPMSYCTIQLQRKSPSSHLFTIKVELFAGTSPLRILDVLSSLRNTLASLNDVTVLEKQIGKFLVGNTNSSHLRKGRVDVEYNHATWKITKQPQLLSLIMRYHLEIQASHLIESGSHYAIFAKLLPTGRGNEPTFKDSPGDLIQYGISTSGDKAIVNLHMEAQSGKFFPFRSVGSHLYFAQLRSKLHSDDQDCGRALQCWIDVVAILGSQVGVDGQAHLLALSPAATRTPSQHREIVEHLLKYSGRITRHLRFYPNANQSASDILIRLTERTLLSQKLDVVAHRLMIDDSTPIAGCLAGLWFAIKLNQDTLGFVHLATANIDSEAIHEASLGTYRKVTYFAVNKTNLYHQRNAITIDGSDERSRSEFFCATRLADAMDAIHPKNFSLATYLAFRAAPPEHLLSFDILDIEAMLEPLRFVQVLAIDVPDVSDVDPSLNAEATKLAQDLSLVLLPLRESKRNFYFCNPTDDAALDRVKGVQPGTSENMSFVPCCDAPNNANLTETSATNANSQVEQGEGEAKQAKTPIADTGSQSMSNSMDTYATVDGTEATPILFRFRKLGKRIRNIDLYSLSKRAKLTVEVSIPKTEAASRSETPENLSSTIPQGHRNAIQQLDIILRSYAAELTLERMLKLGSKASNENIQTVRRCIRQVRDVASQSIELFFYNSRNDLMIPAFMPGEFEADIDRGVQKLIAQITKNRELHFHRIKHGCFRITPIGMSDKDYAEYWAFATIDAKTKSILVEVYHHDGRDSAIVIMNQIRSILNCAAYLVNQELLLESLHHTRTASTLLMIDPRISSKTIGAASGAHSQAPLSNQDVNQYHSLFAPGIFGCPVVYEKSFKLYRSTSTSPQYIARTLATTVLQPFAILNRPGFFVYRDTNASIFYMSLKTDGNEKDGNSGSIRLVVRGIHPPGSEVTTEFTRILQRRIMKIVVEMIESSLKGKNPIFTWKREDFHFLESFNSEWNALADETAAEEPHDWYYEFPSCINDPYLVLLMFHQNMCGSTFFHRLYSAEEESAENAVGANTPNVDHPAAANESSEQSKMEQEQQQQQPADTSEPEASRDYVHLIDPASNDFTIYYNSYPAQPEPGIQSVSTLSLKGFEFSRSAGNGIAVVELGLFGPNGKLETSMHADRAQLDWDAENVAPGRMRAKKVARASSVNFSLRIRITDTGLNRKSLHEWMALSLDQSIFDWVAERQVDRLVVGPSKKLRAPLLSAKHKDRDTILMNRTFPGLAALTGVLEASHDLPQPTVVKIDLPGVIRASTVASTTLKLLQRSIFNPIASEANDRGMLEMLKRDTKVIRLTRSRRPQSVAFKYNSGPSNIFAASGPGNGTFRGQIKDMPIDCPEYICFFCSSPEAAETRASSSSSSSSSLDGIRSKMKLYTNVDISRSNLSKGRHTALDYADRLDQHRPSALRRSFAFIFSCKRNRRILWMYNWHPDLAKAVRAKLEEADQTMLSRTETASFQLQARTLKMLTPPNTIPKQINAETTTVRRGRHITKTDSSSSINRLDDGMDESESDERKPSANDRRVQRPTIIRRPKLVGKSFAGATMQAVAASRARASSQQFKLLAKPPAKLSIAQHGADGRSDEEAMTRRVDAIRALHPAKQPLGRDPTAAVVQQDETLKNLESDVRLLSSLSLHAARRWHTLQAQALSRLTTSWWPHFSSPAINKTTLDFFKMRSPCTFSRLGCPPQLPKLMANTFLLLFGEWLDRWMKNVSLMNVYSNGEEAVESIFFMSNVQNLNGSRCFALIEIQKMNLVLPSTEQAVIRATGWLFMLNRPVDMDAGEKTGISKPRSLLNRSKKADDAIAMDRLATNLLSTFDLDCLLFDFGAAHVHRRIRQPDIRNDFSELLPFLRRLMEHYPLDMQERMRRLNHRIFEYTITLRSFQNRLINLFNGPRLMDYMWMHREKRDLMRRGASLCSRKLVIADGTHSTCFLRANPSHDGRLKVLILCRTHGKSLSDTVVEPGKIETTTVMEKIKSVASQLVYAELTYAAKKLRLNSLWRSLSSPNMTNTALQPMMIEEFFTLCYVHSVLDALDTRDKDWRLQLPADWLRSRDNQVNWRRFVVAMINDDLFSAHLTLPRNPSRVSVLFRMQAEDVFILIEIHRMTGNLHSANLIEKERNPATKEAATSAASKFVNFLFSFMSRNS